MLQMKILFRVDASLTIGTGHVMRCLTLAKSLAANGAQCYFVCREHPGNLINYILQQGFEVVALPNPKDPHLIGAEREIASLAHEAWLGCDWSTDASQTKVGAGATANDWLVVDHYALDARWESAMRNVAKKIMVIDDLADRQHDCDVLLDQNFYADMSRRYDGKVPAHCQLLLGPHYALLRDEFRQLHEQIKPRSGRVKRVLVFFGGVDFDNNTARAIEALASIDGQNWHVDVVIGEHYPHREEVETACAKQGFVCHVQISRMAELIALADVAIGAGGTTTWERCCLGLPTLTLCVAANQGKQIADAASKGLLYAPELEGELTLAIGRHLLALLENDHLRQAISRNGIQTVDGRGTLRVIGNLGCSDIKIRVASLADSESLFGWRNHQSIRMASRNSELINWEDHQKWFASVQASPDRLLLIGQRDGQSIGVVRFDIQDDTAEVSIYLVPNGQESGRGQALLQRAEKWLSANRPSVNKICAHVLGGNERSQYLFSDAGYQVESISYSKRLY
jgi:UDP-2,4-diacetamido-2,4,6-trideoxy-beta-L-altropyranose hydrolase